MSDDLYGLSLSFLSLQKCSPRTNPVVYSNEARREMFNMTRVKPTTLNNFLKWAHQEKEKERALARQA